ncbi:protein glycosylation K [Spirochaetia bacterium]|nr:protein glycosylation K [Spirochaetia bacterium]
MLLLLFLTIILSVIETVGISIIMPFISVASNPAIIDGGRYNIIYNFLNFTSKRDFIIVFGIGILLFYVLRSGYSIFYTYILNRFAFGTYRHLARRLYGIYLRIPYKVYVTKNSAELLNSIGLTTQVSSMLQLILQVCSDTIIILMLYTLMIVVNWQMTIILTCVLTLLVIAILKIIIKRTREYGRRTTETQNSFNRILNETHGNFKLIKLKGIEAYNDKMFDKCTEIVTKAQVSNQTLGTMPRTILETVGFSLLVVSVLFILLRYGSAERIIPIIAMYALSLYRILPALNKILNNVTQITFLHSALDIVFENTKTPTEQNGCCGISFNNSIRLENISFKYLTGHDVIQNISFEIKKGDKIAITGNSGGGKSTLLDIIIGINQPTNGCVYMDNVKIDDTNINDLRSKIGYIPQNIYLFDNTVANNVVFGSEYNEAHIIEVLKMAKIWDILLQKEGLDTRVGEGGILLSGGQKQRIAIARALYNDPDILVLDEATSALDNQTEEKIMDEIYDVSKNKTLIIAAHRLSTIQRCTKIINIDNEKISITSR